MQGRLYVSGGATLTVEAGATVLFDSGARVTFGRVGDGTLRVLGTVDYPVIFQALDSTSASGSWIGLALRSNTQSELHYLDMSGCGLIGVAVFFFDSIAPSCIGMGNPALPNENPTLLVDHVTIHDGSGGAVILSNDSHFAVGSTHLSVANMNGYVAKMRAREAARFPLGGAFTGNDSNEVRLTGDTLRSSATWAVGVPWTVVDGIYVEGPNQPVLTIPPGDTIRTKGGGAIMVGVHAPGSLQAGAENAQPVVFRAADSSWGGITLSMYTVNSAITNAVFDNCGHVENVQFEAACVFVQGDYYGVVPDPAPVLRHLTIRTLTVGLGLGTGGRLGAGSAYLSIIGVPGPQRLYGFGPPIEVGHRSSPGSIPPGDYTGTLRDEIWLTQLQVTRDDTFPNLGIPYLVFNGISVGDSTNTHPTLSLAPGTTFAFTSGSHLWVGSAGPGVLRALGTAAQPVTLTGQGTNPGAWAGVNIGYYADSLTLFDHVIVDRAGAADPWVAGSFQFYKDIGPVIRNSMISNSAGCAINIINQPAWSTDFTDPALANSFVSNVGGAQCGP